MGSRENDLCIAFEWIKSGIFQDWEMKQGKRTAAIGKLCAGLGLRTVIKQSGFLFRKWIDRAIPGFNNLKYKMGIVGREKLAYCLLWRISFKWATKQRLSLNFGISMFFRTFCNFKIAFPRNGLSLAILIPGLFLVVSLANRAVLGETHPDTEDVIFDQAADFDTSELVDVRIFGVVQVLEEWQPDWSAEETLSLAQHIVDEADGIGVPVSLLLAVIEVESSFDPCAVSPVGAKGLMQIMPSRILGPDQASSDFAFNHHLVFDPHWNISFGAAYLSRLINRFGSIEMALAAYNRGPTRLRRQLKNQTFRGCNYTQKVFKKQEAYALHAI